MIIGISGKAESGKDTAANMLKILYGNPNISYEDYNNKNYNKFADIEVIHFADILKETAMTMCVLSEEDVCTQHGKKRKIEWLGITVRELLQKLGTCIRQNIDEDFWVKSLWAVVDNWNNVIIADVRFPNEVNSIKERGGIVIRLNRNTSKVDNHISETAVDNYKEWDLVIDNNSTKEDLFNTLKKIVQKYPLK